jgi:uncharacterized cupin superfamily protein
MVYKKNVNDIDWAEMRHGERFHHRRKTLTPMDQPYVPKLGMSLYRLDPGKRSFPFHQHMANDEAILVTRGSGTLRYGADEIALVEGDYVHLPAASGSAHHMINSSDDTLEYYCLSSTITPEVVLYPDSNKLGAISLLPSADGKERQRMASFLRHERVEYWDGEESGP